MKFEEISEKVKKISKDTVAEVQKLNEVRKLHGKISDAKKQINEVYIEMGKKLYDQYKDSALTGYETEIQTITQKLEMIDELKVQMRDVKGVVLCPCCNMEVALGEKFCSNCGNKMPEIIDVDAEDFEEAEDEEVTESEDESDAEETEGVEEVSEEVSESGSEETVEETVEDVAEESAEETPASEE